MQVRKYKIVRKKFCENFYWSLAYIKDNVNLYNYLHTRNIVKFTELCDWEGVWINISRETADSMNDILYGY